MDAKIDDSVTTADDDAKAKAKVKGDPTLSFRVPEELEKAIDRLREEIVNSDDNHGRRSDVCRAVLKGVLGQDKAYRIIDAARRRGETFTRVLDQVVLLGIEKIESDTDAESTSAANRRTQPRSKPTTPVQAPAKR